MWWLSPAERELRERMAPEQARLAREQRAAYRAWQAEPAGQTGALQCYRGACKAEAEFEARFNTELAAIKGAG